MKVYIVGSIASGKSTFAKQLSEETNIKSYCLDNVVYEPDKSNPWGNKKCTTEERDNTFKLILQQNDWIIEDTGRPCFEEGFKQASNIILIELPIRTRNQRIIFRWIKQKLNIAKCIYKPRFAMLKCMLQWSKDYDLGKDKLKERIALYQNKVTYLKNNKEIAEFLRKSF